MNAKLFSTLFSRLLRNPTFLLAPAVIIAILLTPLAQNFKPVAIWYDRSYDVLSLTSIVCPFVAAMGAWEAARVARLRKKSGEQSITWVRQVVIWAKTAVWGLLLYLFLWAVAWVITTAQATWGGPLWGPPLMGAVAVLAASALGYTVGDLWPSYFIAPVIGVVLFVLQAWLSSLGEAHNPIGYITPNLALHAGFLIWYNVRSDLVIIQATFALGLLALSLASFVFRKWITGKKAYPGIVAICGIIFVFASFAGIANSSVDQHGVRVSLWYNTASDAPIPYTPVCSHAALPVCVHPAYSAELMQLSSLINQVAVPLVGIPGAPVVAEHQTVFTPGNDTNFHDTTFQMNGNVLNLPSLAAHALDWASPSFIQQFATQIAVGLVVAPGQETTVSHNQEQQKHLALSTNQQAIALYLLQQAHITPDTLFLQVSAQARMFEENFASQALTTRHAWLAQHYTALLRGN